MAVQEESGGVLVEFEPMSPEERDRMMQFLLNQQAQFAADLARSEERSREWMAHAETRLGRIEGAVMGLTSIVGRVVDLQERAERRMTALDSRVDRVAAVQARTEEHLGIVVTMFERHLREDHGVN